MSDSPLYDSHCHLDRTPDPAGALARAREAGLDALLVPAVEPAGWDALGALAARMPPVRIALGIHPFALAALDERALDEALQNLADRARGLGACAIGECGVDARIDSPLTRQLDVLDVQVEIARALGLPIVLHVVGAQGAALARMQRHGPLARGGVVHAYSGPVELLPRWAALGFRIAIGPAVLRPRARRLVEVARRCPLERLLLETDAPDGRVDPARTGEPADVAVVASRVAAIRGIDERTIRAAAHDNATELFG